MTEPFPRACLMGHPVAHSRSPMIHNHWLAKLGLPGRYELQDIAPGAFEDFLTHLGERGFVGGNITVPHKEAAYRLVTRRDPDVEAVGAVNVVWYDGNSLRAGNSDVYGFMKSLDDQAAGWDVPGCRAVVLGAGGAARSAVYKLRQRGVGIAIVNRTLARAEELAARFGPGITAHEWGEVPRLLREADVLVNCTSNGMVGKPALDIDLAPLKPSAVVYDVVYVPLETALLAQARRRGHRTVDGLWMLLHQAGFGFHKWFGVEPTVTQELRALVEADILAKTPKS